MAIDLYWFSGTGNSLFVARELAERLPGTTLRPLMAGPRTEGPPADALGVVFPLHAFSLPRVVADFLKVLTVSDDTYCFLVSTKGGSAELSLHDADRILRRRGHGLDAFFTVEMPNNTFFIHDIDTTEQMAEKFRQAPAAVQQIARVIRRRETRLVPDKMTWWRRGTYRAVHGILARTGFLGFGQALHVDTSCTACGVCASVCPQGRIELNDGRVRWRSGMRCLVCAACVSYCPAGAIGNRSLKRSKTQRSGRYHHPVVTASQIGAQRVLS